MNIAWKRDQDPRNFELIGLPPVCMLDEVCAAWREAGLNVEECLQRCATVTREFVYTPGGHGDLRRSFTPKFNQQHSVPVKHKTLAEILNPQPRAAAVFHRLLDWIDRVDMASQRGEARPEFATPDGMPIFPEGENEDGWWLTHQRSMSEPPKKAPADAVMEDGPPQSDDEAPPADDELLSDDDEAAMSDEEEEVGDGFGCESQSQNAAPKDHDPDILWTRPPTLERPPPCYFERQRDAQCGMHALNNAVGWAWQSIKDMQRAADVFLNEMESEGSPEMRSQHIAPGGWYSSEVLATAIRSTSMHKIERVEYQLGLQLLHVNPDRIYSSLVEGGVVNLKDKRHWVAVRFINGKLFLLDSQRGRPIVMSERGYRTFVKKNVGGFCIERAQDMSPSAPSASSGHDPSLD